ncbi:MAG: hypothetical protein IJV04_03565, partial [Lachnospiraceae bacterium]|nr:hypothetical protein [Lachnospiraceae bacterium]
MAETESIFKDIIPAFRFMIVVNGFQEIPLKSVRAFTREFEYDFIQEGGINDYVHIIRKQATKPFTLQVERYATPDNEDPISEGTVFQLPMQLVIGENDGTTFRRKRTYILLWPRVLNKEIGALDAERSGLLIETVTFAYSHMILLNSGTDDKHYEFGKKGNAFALNRYIQVPQNEMGKKDFEEKAEEQEPWKWSAEGSFRGEGKRRARTSPNELRKAQMKSNAKRYRFGDGEDRRKDRSTFESRAKKYQFGQGTRNDMSGMIEKANANRWLWGTDDKNFLGGGKRNAKTNKDELRRGTMEAKANENKWRVARDGSYVGIGQRRANITASEKRKGDMIDIAAAHTWFWQEDKGFLGGGRRS